jgi:phosphohistidine phosphatase
MDGLDQHPLRMKTLYLLRHAKSSWKEPALSDHDRPLAPRGARAAGQMATHIAQTAISPALVLCSSARRARGTLDAIAHALTDATEVRIEKELYAADATQLLARLRTVPSDTLSVMLIGHNPGLQDLAVELSDEGEEDALRQLSTKFPTAALATLDLAETDWSELGPRQAYLQGLVLPRQLDEGLDRGRT